MKKSLLVAALLSLPILAGGVGLVSAKALRKSSEQVENAKGYICPVTGEELACECCCPLNNRK